MLNLPDPAKFDDPIKFLRAMHAIVLQNSNLLEKLAEDARQHGVFKSFATHTEWSDLFLFYTKAAPQHEKSEEECLFPVLEKKLPRMGFQSADSPIRFLIEGHEVLQTRMIPLVKAWQQYQRKQRNAESLDVSATRHAAEDAEFVAIAKELAALYRDHVKTEEEKVYGTADELLGPEERAIVLRALRAEYDNEAITEPMYFDRPQFSNPQYNIVYTRGPERDSD